MIIAKTLDVFEEFVDTAKKLKAPYHIIANITDSYGRFSTPGDWAKPPTKIDVQIILFSSLFTVRFTQLLPIDDKTDLENKLESVNAKIFKKISINGQDITCEN